MIQCDDIPGIGQVLCKFTARHKIVGAGIKGCPRFIVRKTLRQQLKRRFYAISILSISILGWGGINASSAQDMQIRIKESPPPTTFAGLLKIPRAAPAPACNFSALPLDTSALATVSLADSALMRLPRSWQRAAFVDGDDPSADTRFIVSDQGRIHLRRLRNGASSRGFMTYLSGEQPTGTTCMIDRGATGVLWTFYPPDPARPNSPRPYLAFGDVITPSGAWYGLIISTATAAQQPVLANLLSEITLLAPPTEAGRADHH